MPSNISLDDIARSGLEKCLSRISRISTGQWRAAMVTSSTATPRSVLARYAGGGAVSVFFKLEDMPLAAVMIVPPGDVECISRGFTGHSFPKTEKTSMAEEIMLTELGNILLNALVNSLLNAMKASALPAMPRFVEGDADALCAELSGQLALDKDCRIISAAISLQCDGLASWTLHAFTPEDLARKIEQL